jgi:hypothetical protein
MKSTNLQRYNYNENFFPHELRSRDDEFFSLSSVPTFVTSGGILSRTPEASSGVCDAHVEAFDRHVVTRLQRNVHRPHVGSDGREKKVYVDSVVDELGPQL